ncbi:nuclear transport factor 2 family protein [Vallicoccus soli]|uniref:Nuclear transport factor 2 family protein n=1 Tax=Vallicoccus soli TaxID=2339232 RepID=A0A3A3YYT2_9ACTN|nr:nuclear transport factor 2 family protein [Vallicoccus soli]RJK95992.1 nuclear transport factor 2 family protein [Vallicoccus soli]
MTSTTSTPHDELPAAIRAYLAAHAARDTDTALRAFAPDAVVVDDGATYRGTEEVRRFLSRAGAGFTYTTRLLAARRDDAHWLVTQRLQGDFPGGVVDLGFRFTLDGDRVAELVIAP